MIFLYVYSRDLTFSLGSSARSSAPSLCSPRCSSRRCPARLATSCFADSGVWSRGASPCCPQRLLPPPRWRPCNHHHPPSRITSPPEMDPNDRQNTRLDLTGKSTTVFVFFFFLSPSLFFPLTGDPTPRQFYSHTAGRPITPPHPPFWRTSRHEHRAAISRVVTIPRDCARPSDRFRPEIYRFRNCTQLAPCPERGRRAKGGIESGWSIGG